MTEKRVHPMTDRSNITSLVNFPADSEQNLKLAKILATEVEPVIGVTLRKKLGVTLKNDDFSKLNQDALEIAGDVRVHIVAELRRCAGTGNEAKVIRNLSAYTLTSTLNAYREYLRSRFPERRRIKRNLRYLLSHHNDFVLWENADGWRCADRRAGRDASSLSVQEIETVILDDPETECLDRPDQLIQLVRTILTRAAGSIAFDDMVAIVSCVQKLCPSVEVDVESIAEPGTDEHIEEGLELRETLENLWREIGNLSLAHRVAVMMNLRSRSGESVIGYFPLLRIASVRSIAEALEFDLEGFAEIWNELPWDDLQIAERLGISRQQVINLRQSARMRLARIKRNAGD